jgi:large subunit ribosomal protein L17
MPRPRKGKRLGSGPAHQKLMLANLASSLITEERITTTITKAKVLRPYVEKMITKAGRGDLASRRQIMKDIHDTEVVTKLFDEVAPRYTERPGGYTRIVRVGPRRGDASEMAIIELV